ncbi:recombinase family protein [Chakrabartyella piscis]|uniref:recombinase family protein n=1 Tax=Chakrabartyella piscis TaxID=2918914 RepID=UPI002958C7F8|nr:recombinase family protein [Chakrabartyella piscis]
MLGQQKITILYCRLSNEDLGEGESNSIQNQKILLTSYAKKQGYTNLKILVDDGYTGTNFNRPAVQEGLDLVKQGLVSTWIVKDMSRFGRDYLTVGQYTELVFPSQDVRFIAVNDGVDSICGDSDGFAAIRNLFNEWYPRDTSKKVRAVFQQKGASGKHLGRPPYGYQIDPLDKEHWILDEEAAPVVKRIFDLSIAGKGPCSIARILEQDKVLTAKSLYAQRKGRPLPERPYHWIDQSIVGILERMDYTGCTCNFKSYSKSYKLKKRIPTQKEEMAIFPNTQEAIVDKAQWDRVQELRQHKRRMTKGDRQGLFSGLLRCADCDGNLHFATSASYGYKQDHYVCGQYKSGRGTCSAHYIREEVLRALVLDRIRAVNTYIRQNVEGFEDEWMQSCRDQRAKSQQEHKRQIAQTKKRLDDIETLLTRCYEDMVLGTLSRERYLKLSEGYEVEQEQLQLELDVTEEWVEQQESLEQDLRQFITLVDKYIAVPELTQTIVNEYIHKILIYAPEKAGRIRTQRVKIIFNFVDELDIPMVNQIITHEQPIGTNGKKKKTA